MEDLFPALFWSGPIGIGAFLAGLGVLFWGIGRLPDSEKKTRNHRQSGPSAKGD
jgi:hypothetical protein